MITLKTIFGYKICKNYGGNLKIRRFIITQFIQNNPSY